MHPWAREFTDPDALTVWRVRLVRLGPTFEVSLWGGRLGPVALRFDNGLERRFLKPAPADWRECDAAALWRYCQQARPDGMRRAATGNGQEPAPPPAPASPDTGGAAEQADSV